jgi:Holliday junction DNA helicase RuvA
MIGRIRGKLLEKIPPDLLVDVGGVAYEIQAPMSTFYQLPNLGESVTLHTHLVVREDAQLLYGFHNQHERRLFRSLIKVNGVGPKMALTILSGIESDEFVRNIHDNDTAALVKLPGVGKKTAERLIIEMKDRLKDWLPNDTSFELTMPESPEMPASNIAQEAESALLALGYKAQEASKAISKVRTSAMQTSEELIRAALKGMVK